MRSGSFSMPAVSNRQGRHNDQDPRNVPRHNELIGNLKAEGRLAGTGAGLD
jgi:hypothetical protein